MNQTINLPTKQSTDLTTPQTPPTTNHHQSQIPEKLQDQISPAPKLDSTEI